MLYFVLGLRIDEITSPPMRCAHVTDRRSREVDHDRHWHILLAYISYLTYPHTHIHIFIS